MKKSARKTDKICLVCGNSFKGTAAAQTCSGSCRTALSRLKEARKRPEFILLAKGKGQKIPDLNAPKRLVFKKTELKPKEEPLFVSQVMYATPTQDVFDGIQAKTITMDEMGLFPKIQTKEEIEAHNAEIEKQIEKIKKETLPPGMMPRAHILDKEIRIDDLLKSKKQLL